MSGTKVTIDRRAAIGLIGSGAALPAMARAADAAAPGRFAHGVASGDPTPRGAILWTRVTPASAALPSAWIR